MESEQLKVLIVYGSQRGGTEGIAQVIADSFPEEDVTVTVASAKTPVDVSEFDAAIIAGSLYMKRWNKDAARFVKRNSDDFLDIPVWLVSSGPLDDSATKIDIAPVRGVAKLMRKVNARGHKTFGGRLESGTSGFIASRMAKTMAGDWRDVDQINAWTQSIYGTLKNRTPRASSNA